MTPDALVRSGLARAEPERWPWTIPALAALEELPLVPAATFLVGENGAKTGFFLRELFAE
jgi:predicted ATPase